jgi:hypothetical protein
MWSACLRYHVECEFVSSIKLSTYTTFTSLVENGDFSIVGVVDNWAELIGYEAVARLAGAGQGKT